MGCLSIQLLLNYNTWRTRYIIPEKYRYRMNSIDWTLLSLNFTVQS